MNTTLLLANPNAGGQGRGSSKRMLSEIAKLGSEIEIVFSRSALDTQEVAHCAVARGIKRIIACGGDGTIHAVLQAVVGTSTDLGILPMGRGNDIARNLRIPRNLPGALQIINTGETCCLDVGRVGNRFFLGVCGAGLDSQVNRFADDHGRRLPGFIAYPFGLAVCLPRFSPLEASIRHQKGGFAGRIMFLAVGNLIAYGGGMKIVPYAKPNDGVLDVCLVKACSAFRLLTTFPRVYFGRHLLAGLTEYWQTDYLEIETEQEAEVRADGEFVQMTPARITVVPKAVHVILPRPFTAG